MRFGGSELNLKSNSYLNHACNCLFSFFKQGLKRQGIFIYFEPYNLKLLDLSSLCSFWAPPISLHLPHSICSIILWFVLPFFLNCSSVDTGLQNYKIFKSGCYIAWLQNTCRIFFLVFTWTGDAKNLFTASKVVPILGQIRSRLLSYQMLLFWVFFLKPFLSFGLFSCCSMYK